MKQVEVSAISNRVAISPDGNHVYMYWPNWKGGWCECEVQNTLSFWNIVTMNCIVHRGIFKIKVVED